MRDGARGGGRVVGRGAPVGHTVRSWQTRDRCARHRGDSCRRAASLASARRRPPVQCQLRERSGISVAKLVAAIGARRWSTCRISSTARRELTDVIEACSVELRGPRPIVNGWYVGGEFLPRGRVIVVLCRVRSPSFFGK